MSDPISNLAVTRSEAVGIEMGAAASGAAAAFAVGLKRAAFGRTQKQP